MQKKICGIYKITSPSGRIYIGQSVDIEKRKRYYKNMSCKAQLKIYRSLKKYGFTQHSFEVIHECKPNELNELEYLYVLIFDTFNSNHGLNLRNGGGNKGNHSNESRKRMSLARYKLSDQAKKNMRVAQKNKTYKHPPEACKKMSERMIGNKHLLGHKHSDETKIKQSLASSLRKHTEETKAKIGAIHKGRIFSEETKHKMSIAKIGIKLSQATKDKLKGHASWNKGKKGLYICSQETKEKLRIKSSLHRHTDESRKKISISNKGKPKLSGIEHPRSRPVLQIFDNGETKKWINASIAGRELKIGGEMIGRVCLGKQKKYKGFKWKFI